MKKYKDIVNEKKKSISPKDFEHQMMDKGRLPNIMTGFLIAIFFSYFSGIPQIETQHRERILFTLFCLFIVVFLQFVIAPKTNRLITKNISDELEKHHKEEFSLKRRTLLLKAIMECPIKIAVQVGAVMGTGIFVTAFVMKLLFPKLLLTDMIFIGFSSTYTIYLATMLAYNYGYSMCSKTADELSLKGLDRTIVHKKKYFNSPARVHMWFYIIIPFIFCCSVILTYMLCNKGKIGTGNFTSTTFIINIGILSILGFLISLILAILFYKQFTKDLFKINQILEKVVTGSQDYFKLPTNLGTELSYNFFLAEEIFQHFQNISREYISTNKNISTISDKLTATVTKNEQYANLQSGDVGTCLITMQEITHGLMDITKQMYSITVSANKTNENISQGKMLLDEEIKKINQISQKNMETIQHVKDLSEKVESIWQILNSIDRIVNKTKKIAFNAELEAASAGDRSDSFHIVAHEIRDLAENISSSTAEIKERITQIQQSSDKLIISSESGTKKINDRAIFFEDMEEKVGELNTSSIIIKETTNKIQDEITELDSDFKQIVLSLQQINKGTEEFNTSAKSITMDSRNLTQKINTMQNDIMIRGV